MVLTEAEKIQRKKEKDKAKLKKEKDKAKLKKEKEKSKLKKEKEKSKLKNGGGWPPLFSCSTTICGDKYDPIYTFIAEKKGIDKARGILKAISHYETKIIKNKYPITINNIESLEESEMTSIFEEFKDKYKNAGDHGAKFLIVTIGLYNTFKSLEEKIQQIKIEYEETAKAKLNEIGERV